MGVINQLPQSVVNRIAAGEVVARPANAIKELVENCLDAGATQIVITIKQGGLELIQVQDNGKGFLKDDLELACVRFATSKLHDFDDLQEMQTYGFRGEALASLSLVAKVNIVSRTEGQSCAYQAKYNGCQMVSIKPSAGSQGTCITAEDIFYDAPSRRQSLKPSEEASRIENVIIKYAVHRPDVSFALRGGGSRVFRTKGDGNRETVLGALIGSDLAQTRKKSFFIFINGRSVNCGAIRSSLETLFVEKDLICPFVLLSLVLEPCRIDVNAHPTKEDVIFLEEEAIVEDISQYIRLLLPSTTERQNTQESVSFEALKVIPVKESPTRISKNSNKSDESPTTPKITNGNDKNKEIYCHQQIRTDHLERSLHIFSADSLASAGKNNNDIEMVLFSTSEPHQTAPQEESVRVRDLQLESIHRMKGEICREAAQSLRELFKEHTFVGCIDVERLLLQHGTAMYAINLKNVLLEFFYQTIVFGFGNLGCFKLEEPISVAELIYLFLDDELNEQEIIQNGVRLLAQHANMLEDYFSLSFEMIATEDGCHLHLTGIPSLLTGFLPQLEGFPQLIKDLLAASWDKDEETCFKSISYAIATFFSLKNDFCNAEYVSGLSESAEWLPLIRDHLLPRLQQRLIPQEKFKDGETVSRVVDQHDIYTVFERC